MNIPISPVVSSLLKSKVLSLIVLGQIALTIAVVSNAAFFAIEKIQLIERDTGLAETELLTVTVNPTEGVLNVESLQQSIRKVAGVENVSVVIAPLLAREGSSSSYLVDPDDQTLGNGIEAQVTWTDHNFIDTIGVKLIAGRNFSPEETSYAYKRSEVFDWELPVIVSKAFAEALFPKQSALGQVIYNNNKILKIVGIIEKMHSQEPKRDIAEYQIIYSQMLAMGHQVYLIRAKKQNLRQIKSEVTGVLLTVSSKLIVDEPKLVADYKRDYYQQDTLLKNALLGLIGALIIITCLGIVGMALFNISRKVKQIGTRRALGASRQDIMLQFFVENTILSTMGIFLGVVMALVINMVLMSNYAMEKLNIDILLLTCLSVFVLTSLAVILPAKRAASISPAIATRNA